MAASAILRKAPTRSFPCFKISNKRKSTAMEVDDTERKTTIPLPMAPQVDSNPGSPRSPKDRLIELLDQAEVHVERLRRDALKLEEDKDSMLTTLDTLKNSELMVQLSEGEREDVVHYMDLVSARCHTVEVFVKTTRDQTQEESLHQVNSFIDRLVVGMQTDPSATKVRCVTYMNACSSQVQGNTDKMFETAILGCTLDDQKRVKKRLQGLLDYIDKTSNKVEFQSTLSD